MLNRLESDASLRREGEVGADENSFTEVQEGLLCLCANMESVPFRSNPPHLDFSIRFSSSLQTRSTLKTIIKNYPDFEWHPKYGFFVQLSYSLQSDFQLASKSRQKAGYPTLFAAEIQILYSIVFPHL